MNNETIENLNDLNNPLVAQKNPLKHVLSQNEKIKVDVEKVAEQISSVNAVLKNDDKVIAPFPTIAEVIAQNEEAEKKVAKAAEDLNQVNTELTQQVAENFHIEAELIQIKSELFEVRADLSKAQAKEKDALHIALHDPLTGLPNRLLLEQSLDHGLIQARRHSLQMAIMFIDLDKFKNINDSYGHDIGDQVLITVARRLQAFIRSEDLVSRWGGDEFICIIFNVNLDADVISLANKLVDEIAKEYEFDGIVFSVSATIGIAICPRDGETADILFKQVDRAMYRSKGTDQRVRLFGKSILEVPAVE